MTNDIFDLIQMNLNQAYNTTKLPYNIYQEGDNDYVLEMAVAGFDKDDIEVTLNKNTLSISGKSPDESNVMKYFHRGLARRKFNSNFTLGRNTIVKDAVVSNGILKITMEEQVPDEDKPKRIEIK